MVSCTLCGRCCHYRIGDTLKRCKFLRRSGTRYLCSVYGTRLGRVLHKDPLIICTHRVNSSFNYKDCSFNVPDNILFDSGY